MNHTPIGLGGIALLVAACAADPSSDETSAASDDALRAEWGEIDEDTRPIDAASLALAAEDTDDPGDDALAGDDRDLEVRAPPVLDRARAASCNPETSLTLPLYYEVEPFEILDALKKHDGPCTSVLFAVPKYAPSPARRDGQLFPRRIAGDGFRAWGAEIRQTAEFHWSRTAPPKDGSGVRYPGWAQVEVIKTGPGRYTTREIPSSRWYQVDWRLKGIFFRQRMAKACYRPQLGDTWHVNEVGSSWTRSTAYQRAMRDLVRGLTDGDPKYDAATDPDPAIASKSTAEKAEITKAARMPNLRGVLYVASLGKRRSGEADSEGVKAALRETLRHKRFWEEMARGVEHFAVERYLSKGFCKRGDALDAQARAMGEVIEALPLTAARVPRYTSGPDAGKSPVQTALSYLARRHTPILGAAWGTDANAPLGVTAMGKLASAQIMATRRYANEHRFAEGRVGLYWRPKNVADDARLAERVATMLNATFDGKDGRATDACGAGGVLCNCGD